MYKLSLNELASEGERLCKSNDCANGIKYFEEAVRVFNQLKEEKTEQELAKLLHLMSIVYNQMGNSYFYLQDYSKALEYHKKDLDLSEQFGDESGKAKACGNIGNTLQLLGDYDEAILYSLRNLEISRQLNDSTGEARALYNLANIYQSKGKHMGRLAYNDGRDPNNTEFANEIKEVLMKAVYYYQETLKLVSAKDRAAEGRTYGNLGNTYYLLGEFESAIECHNQRLKIAKEYGDRAAERRAYSNLGNAHIFLGKFNEATEYYLKAMNTARALGDKAIEAQSYHSLGNAYILLQDYSVAIDFHLRHLQIAQLLDDKVGESRAYWSLGNAYAALGDLGNAISYAQKHLKIARLIGDSSSELTAKMNLYDFQNLLSNSGIRDGESGLFTPISSKYGRKYLERPSSIRKSISIDSFYNNTAMDRLNPKQKKHIIYHNDDSQNKNDTDSIQSIQDNLDESKKSSNHSWSNTDLFQSSKISGPEADIKEDDNYFFDALSRIQSNTLDDQRCSLRRLNTNKNQTSNSSLDKKNEKLINQAITSATTSSKTIPDNDFFNLVMKLQRSRLEDQRSSLKISKLKTNSSTSKSVDSAIPPPPPLQPQLPQPQPSQTTTTITTTSNSSKINSLIGQVTPNLSNSKSKSANRASQQQAITVPPDDDFFSMIQKVQSRRLDEQRTKLKIASKIF